MAARPDHPQRQDHHRDSAADQQMMRTASRWVARHSLGTLDNGDRAAFTAWLDADPAHRLLFEQLSETLATFDTAGPVVREADRHARAPAGRGRMRRACVALMIAGLALAPTGAALRLAGLSADEATARGEQRTVRLNDGSHLVLDADSAVDIAYDAAERRIVLLRGRIHAKASHQDTRPFVVAALGGEVEDIGTAFDVSREDSRAMVRVTEGKVLARSGDSVLPLAAGEAARWIRGGVIHALRPSQDDGASAWREGRLYFEQRPFADVVAALDRYSVKPIWLWNRQASHLPVSGVVWTASIDGSLASLARTQGLQVRDLGFALVIL